MWFRKKTGPTYGVMTLLTDIEKLGQRVTQLECEHNMVFSGDVSTFLLHADSYYAIYKCSLCGKVEYKSVNIDLTKKERKALRNLGYYIGETTHE